MYQRTNTLDLRRTRVFLELAKRRKGSTYKAPPVLAAVVNLRMKEAIFFGGARAKVKWHVIAWLRRSAQFGARSVNFERGSVPLFGPQFV